MGSQFSVRGIVAVPVSHPTSVAFAPDGRILTPGGGGIHVAHPNGTFAFTVRPEGDRPGDLWSGGPVAVAPDGRIVVAEGFGRRIAVLHPNGTFDHAFGPSG